MKRASKRIQRPKQALKSPGSGLLVGVRLQPDEIDAVDDWRRKQKDLPTRPEAVRRILKAGLGKA